MTADGRLESLVGALRTHGTRVTPARRALLAALLDAEHHHLSAQDIAAAVQRAVPDVHLSTIYRSLDSLEELGIVDHVHFGHGRAIYHLADEPHQHLVCEVCGATLEAPEDLFEAMAQGAQRRLGFELRPYHFAVLGVCAECAATARDA